MKRMNYFGALAVAAIAFVGCNKVEQSIENEIEKSGIPFEFVASGVETKTTTDGLNTLWASGDKVNLFHAVAGSTTYVSDGAFEATADGASVTFSGTLASALTADNYDWYAIYPQNNNITTPANTGDKGYVTIGSSATGKQAQNDNDSKLHLAGTRIPVAGKVLGVAKDTKPSIAMQHLVSVICVHLVNGTSSPITVSEISFTGTENIVGNYFIDFVNSPVVYTPSDAKYVSSTATLSVTGGAAINPGDDAVFYMAVKPFTAPAGETISLSVTADNGAQVRQKVLAADAVFLPGSLNTLNFTYDKSASGITEPTSKTGWYRVEKTDWLAAEDRVIIVNEGGDKAMSKAKKDNNREGVAVTVEADGDYKHITSSVDEAQVFILETGTVAGSFAFWCENGEEASKYIYAASSSSNHLKSAYELNGNASFVAALPNGVGTLTAQGTNERKVMQWNSASSVFACYASASQDDISIYKYYGAWPGSTTCADPVISQEGNTVTITSTTAGSTIYYTTDGTEPDPSNDEQKYTKPITVTAPITVKAIAVRAHYTSSSVVSMACTVQVATPTISGNGTNFTITCATDGATIYYETSTVDLASVAIPTTSSAVYTSAVAFTQNTFVKAIAVKDGYTNSEVASETCAYSSGGAKDYTTVWTATSGALGSSVGPGTIYTTVTGSEKTQSWSYTRSLISGSSFTGWSSNCIQLGKNGGVENITFSTSNIPGTIKSVSVECSSYKGEHKVSITVGGNSYLSSTATSTWTTVSAKTGVGSSSGEIVISFTGGTRALYIKSITVVYNN